GGSTPPTTTVAVHVTPSWASVDPATWHWPVATSLDTAPGAVLSTVTLRRSSVQTHTLSAFGWTPWSAEDIPSLSRLNVISPFGSCTGTVATVRSGSVEVTSSGAPTCAFGNAAFATALAATSSDACVVPVPSSCTVVPASPPTRNSTVIDGSGPIGSCWLNDSDDEQAARPRARQAIRASAVWRSAERGPGVGVRGVTVPQGTRLTGTSRATGSSAVRSNVSPCPPWRSAQATTAASVNPSGGSANRAISSRIRGTSVSPQSRSEAPCSRTRAHP